jgi:hypothetical protein
MTTIEPDTTSKEPELAEIGFYREVGNAMIEAKLLGARNEKLIGIPEQCADHLRPYVSK